MKSITEEISTSLAALHDEWGAYLALGVILFFAGCYAIYAAKLSSSGAVVTIATLLVIAGLMQVISAFIVLDTAKHIFLALFVGMLEILVGIVFLQDPSAPTATIETQLAMLFTFGGVYRFVVASLLQFPQYGWFAASGLIGAILGMFLWMHFPNSQAFAALAVGLNFIFAGIAWSALALRLKASIA